MAGNRTNPEPADAAQAATGTAAAEPVSYPRWLGTTSGATATSEATTTTGAGREATTAGAAAADPLLSFPKLTLHDHLDGSIRPETLLDLAARAGVALPYDDPNTLAGWFQGRIAEPVVENWDDMFGIITSVMQDRESIIRVAREFVLEAAADGIVYGETRWAPEKHVQGGLTLDDAVEAVTAGLAEGEAIVKQAGGSIRIRQLICAMRTSNRSLEIAELTVRHYGGGSGGSGSGGSNGGSSSVVGFDLAGEEGGYPASAHLPAIAAIEAADIPFTLHAGEMAGVDSIADTLRLAHPLRIGHGTRIAEDLSVAGVQLVTRTAVATVAAHPDDAPELGSVARRIRDRRIPLEQCLTSNSGGFIVGERRDHPIDLFKRLGFTVTVNPDNRLFSGTCITREMRYLVDLFGWTPDDLLDVTRNAVAAAFLTEEQRTALLNDEVLPAVERWLAANA